MKLKLRITEKETKNISNTQHYFTVIDTDISKQYPQNFVSVLPKNIKTLAKPSSVFEGLFGDKSLEMAKQLLEKALKSRPNSETKKSIRKRLKLLELKPVNKTQCQNCGKPIKQTKKRYRVYKFCFECHIDGYPKISATSQST